ITHAPAQVKILAVQEVALVEAADRRKYVTAQKQTGPGYGIDALVSLAMWRSRHVDPRQRRPALLHARESAQAHERAPQAWIASAICPGRHPVRVDDADPDDADLWV